MTRKTRKVSSVNIYHVISRGNNYQSIFESRGDYLHFLKLLKELRTEFQIQIYAYCLMNNHFHLLIRSDISDLEKFMHKLKMRYALWYNKKYDRAGHLFQGPYSSPAIDDPEAFKIVLNYVHQNPVAAHIVEETVRYPWSSYHAYSSGDASLVTINPVLNLFSSVEECLRFLDQPGAPKMRNPEYSEYGRIPEEAACEILYSVTGCTCHAEFQKLPAELQQKYAKNLLLQGLSIRKINRLCGLSRRWLSKLAQTLPKD